MSYSPSPSLGCKIQAADTLFRRLSTLPANLPQVFRHQHSNALNVTKKRTIIMYNVSIGTYKS